MNKNYTVMELEAIKKLCKCVNSVASLPADLIADTNVATNTTYSSYRIDAEMSALENDIQRYVDTALAGLSRLTKEVIDDKALVVKENVLYLYKDPTDMNNDYMQMMLINGVAVELGSTTCDFSSVYSKDEANDKFALKIDLDTLTTSFNDLVTSVDKKIDKDKIVTVLDDTVTDEQVPSAKVIYDELQEVFQSVSSGKELIANAITDKGVNTAIDAEFAIMAENIGKISGGGSETIPTPFIASSLSFNKSRDIIIDISKNYIVITALVMSYSINIDRVAQFTIINGVVNTIFQSSSFSECSLSENILTMKNKNTAGYSMDYIILEM